MSVTVPSNFAAFRFQAKYSLTVDDFWVESGLLVCPSLPNLIDSDLLDCLYTAEELVERAEEGNVKKNAVAGFKALPLWSTWTSQEAKNYIHGEIFAGKTLTEVNTDINSLPATVEGMRTGLRQAASAIVSIRTILEAMSQTIVFIRDVVIRYFNRP